MAITLTVTAKGQITLRREVLERLGVRPGDKVDIDLLRDGRMQIRARPVRPVTSIFGITRRTTPARGRLTSSPLSGQIGSLMPVVNV